MANPSDPPAMTPALFDRPSLESRLAEADADWGSADWPAEYYSGDTRVDLRSCLAEIDRLTKELATIRAAITAAQLHAADVTVSQYGTEGLPHLKCVQAVVEANERADRLSAEVYRLRGEKDALMQCICGSVKIELAGSSLPRIDILCPHCDALSHREG